MFEHCDNSNRTRFSKTLTDCTLQNDTAIILKLISRSEMRFHFSSFQIIIISSKNRRWHGESDEINCMNNRVYCRKDHIFKFIGFITNWWNVENYGKLRPKMWSISSGSICGKFSDWFFKCELNSGHLGYLNADYLSNWTLKNAFKHELWMSVNCVCFRSNIKIKSFWVHGILFNLHLLAINHI